MDMSQYRELFFSETREHLHSFSELIGSLENNGEDREKIDSLFRSAHSIKGMAASMGFTAITELAHRIEDLMEKVRKRIFSFEPGIADLLLQAADLMEGLVEREASGNKTPPDTGDLLRRLADYDPNQQKPPLPQTATGDSAADEEEYGTAPETREEHAGPRPTVRVRTELLDNLINLTGELITNKHRLVNISRTQNNDDLDGALDELSRLLRRLHNEVLHVRMMPFSSITDRFPRIVRDLARKGNKEVAFEIAGKEIELDRAILERLADPLIHILRNAVDHGLETEAERVSLGKERRGKLLLSAVREKDQVIISISDDGKGMDPAKLIATALEKRLITPEAASNLGLRDALLLTCRPGFSTAREITDVSGRGVGMDIVRSTIQTLGGSMQIESELGHSTTIILKLPLTIAIIDVLLIQCAGISFAVPVTSILRTMEISRREITTRGKHRIFYLNEDAVPILSLNRIFGFDSMPIRNRSIPVLISEVQGRKVALAVDQFLGHQEVFVKPLGRPLGLMKGLMGGAIIGNGEVLFILDLPNII